MSDIFSAMKESSEKDDGLKKELEKNRLKRIIQEKLPQYMGNDDIFGTTDKTKLGKIKDIILTIIKKEDTPLRTYEIKGFIEVLVLELTNLGVLTELMEDDEVTEVMVNAYDDIWIERSGVQFKTDLKFKDEDEVLELAKRIARNVGRLIDSTNNYVDARLPDGSRVHIIIPPLSRRGTTITIRKFFKEKLTIDQLIDFETLSSEMADFLSDIVKARANIIVSGGTNSGKTTTLNVVSNFIDGEDRVITAEDSAELQLSSPHVVSLETKNANAEGQGKVTMQDLLINMLRMNPTRIILGEVRDNTAYDLLNAMSTGHEGSMSTIHANNPENCISRLKNLSLDRGSGLSETSILSLIGESVDIIVHVSQMKDRVRRITHISQVYPGDGAPVVKPIFEYKYSTFNENSRLNGEFVRTAYSLSDRLKSKLELSGLKLRW